MTARPIASGATLLAILFLSTSGPAPAGTGAVDPVRHAWGALAGETLRSTLEGWCKMSGWTLVWDTDSDWRLGASARFEADGFEEAVLLLTDALHRSSPDLSVTLYRGNRVLHVETLLTETVD